MLIHRWSTIITLLGKTKLFFEGFSFSVFLDQVYVRFRENDGENFGHRPMLTLKNAKKFVSKKITRKNQKRIKLKSLTWKRFFSSHSSIRHFEDLGEINEITESKSVTSHFDFERDIIEK